MAQASNRQIVALILATPTNYHLLAFRYFILSLNKIQTLYEFSFPDLEVALEEDEYTDEQLFTRISLFDKAISPKSDYTIALTTRKIKGNLFFTSQGKYSVITTDQWETYFSPPSLFEYVLHCISASLLFMHPSLNLDSHTDTRGCVLDYTRIKADDRIDIALGYICDADCEDIKRQVGEEYLGQMQFLISRKWIGTIDDPGSVAFEMKHLFRFDITRDSGFNKTFWERARAKLDEVPFEVIKLIVGTLLAILLAALLVRLGLKKD